MNNHTQRRGDEFGAYTSKKHLKSLLNLTQRKERAILTFLTDRSFMPRVRAVYNAVSVDRRLYDAAFMRRHFNERAQGGGQQPDIRDGRFVAKLHKRAQSLSQWQAAMQLINKSKTHSEWEKFINNNRFYEFSKVMNDVISVQVENETKNKDILSLSSAYEARLDRFTPGLREGDVLDWLGSIEAQRDMFSRMASLRAELYRQTQNDVAALNAVTVPQRNKIIRRILSDMGLNDENADFHTSSHPMCFDKNGRPQILLSEDNSHFIDAVLTALHEGGHALYRLHMGRDVRESLLGMIETDYAGADENMAMLFDHHIAQTFEFAVYLSRVAMEETAGELDISPNKMQRLLLARPHGLRRVEAGPEQYALFMAQYGRLEHGLMSGKIGVSSLGARWNALSQALHGMIPDGSPQQSVFQDPHWALGELGRFSGGYLPGMLMAAQSYEALSKDRPQALTRVAQGDFSQVVSWCEAALYRQPRRENYNNFMMTATGRKLSIAPFMAYVKGMEGALHSALKYSLRGVRAPKAKPLRP